MFTHPILLSEVAGQWQQERLHQAETERLYEQIRGSRSGLFQQISSSVRAIVQRKTASAQSNSVTLTWAKKCR